MEATECVDDCEARTVVLVGKVGNGKSATGNSMLGERAFLSKPSQVGVTNTSHLQTNVVDGQILNVIDTPGLFDYSRKPELIRDEILNCFKMTKDGIHAVLVVLSVRSRYSVEETYAFAGLLEIFGVRISDYMIIVFTCGDDLDENDKTLDDYLGRNCPQPFKEILEICGSRRVLFDNKTRDCCKKSEQVKQLLMLVNEVVGENGGKPYTNELKIDLKMNEVTLELEQLAEEKAARMEAERVAKVALVKSGEQSRLLRENLARAHMEAEKLRNKAQIGGSAIFETLASVHKEAEKLRNIAQSGGSAVMENLANVHKEAEELSIKAQAKGCAIM